MALAYTHLLCIKKTLLLCIPLLHLDLKHNLCQSAISTSLASHTTFFQPHGSQTHGSGFGMSGNASRLNNLRLLKEALQPLHFMDDVDSSTYASLLQGCLNNKALSEGKLVHAHIIQIGFVPNVLVQTNLVTMYAKCGSLKDGRHALQEMGEQNVVSWTAMIAAYSRHGSSDEALRLFHQMQQWGIQPNQFTFASILPACADLASLKHGKEMHRQIIASGIQSNIFVGCALLDMYIKCDSLEDAHRVFEKMPEQNLVTCNAMIAGYAQNGCFEESLKLFQDMHRIGVKPDSDTFASVLSSCANLASLGCGKHIHGGIIKSGFEHNIFVASTLVDMYAKCGVINNARKVFDEMPDRDVVSWNAMIVGYAIQGCGKEALCLFEQMKHYGLKPDHVSLVGVLSACCHAGLVDNAWQYFHSMSHDYHITPAAEHYSCMVDLLGRAGLLYDAYNLINNMPVKPSAFVWGSLLGACRIHVNVELGEYAAEHLFELDPENAAHYVLLSNVYAAAGRWDGVEKVRKLMKERKVTKKPGCSWIEVNSKVYTFLIGDRSHPQTVEIYAKLEKLYGQMKEAGYIPNMSFVQDDAEEQTGNILCNYR